ncbi:hypothetical protein C9J12_21050 [Photobacterium frigidiphilum]|uniref:Uncharacterized protein n=1 Tax=Photobacterium frigidiphilum TaxID=264736 RepID=A0A2T3JA87_9GAMM|nr:hypothetical protein [Photobacterium frigidiphilum]PSU45733.1 hypothetical protein C9J12_21050 [Photobacterium frigidiphilum]
MNSTPLITLSDGLYIDAFVVDDHDEVIFLSLWGRDGDMQHFFAALTLPITQGGFREKAVTLPNGTTQLLSFNRIKDLKKLTTRLPKYTQVGEWVQTWLTLPALMKTQYGSQDAWLLSQQPLHWDDLWPVVKHLCHLPLLDTWKSPLAFMLGKAPFITSLNAWGIHAYRLSYEPEDIESLISDAVKHHTLSLSDLL